MISPAIKLAQPGDTIHLEPGKVHRGYAGFHGKKGEPGKPITLDGHGATLEGSDPFDPAQWREIAPGLFAADGCSVSTKHVRFRRLVRPCLGQIAKNATLEARYRVFEGFDQREMGTPVHENRIFDGRPSLGGANGANLDSLSPLIPKTHRP